MTNKCAKQLKLKRIEGTMRSDSHR